MKALDDLSEAISSNTDSNSHEKVIKDIKKQVKETDGADNASMLSELFKATQKAIPFLLSKDPIKVATGILDTVASYAPMAGPSGIALGQLASLLSGMIGGKGGPEDALKVTITEMMKQFRDEELHDKANGLVDAFKVAQTFMNSLQQREDLTVDDVNILYDEVANDIGVDFLGEFANHILREAGRADSFEKANDVLRLVQLYCQLSLSREMLLQQKYVLTLRSEESSSIAMGVHAVIKSEAGMRRDDLQFILRPPTAKEAIVASVYTSSRWPILDKYMKHVGVKERLGPLKDLKQKLSVQKWPDCFSDNEKFGEYHERYYLSTTQGGGVTVYFEQVDNDYWHINLLRHDLRLSFGGGYWGCNPPDSEVLVKGSTEIKILGTEDGKCLLSPKVWPDHFLYVTNTLQGPLDTYKGDPGEAGYWNIMME